MAVKFGMLVQQMFDLRVLLGTMAFVKSSISVGVSLYETFAVFLLMPTSIFPRSSAQITLLEEVSVSNNMIIGLQTLAKYVVLTILVLCVIFINLMLNIWSTYLLIT